MKRNLFIILAGLFLFFAGCKKDTGNQPSSADSYFPTTAGSSWRYFDIVQDGTKDTIIVKMTNQTAIFNGKTYTAATTMSRQSGAGTEYFYAANHLFALRALNAYAGTTVEFKMFNDTAAVGSSLISSPTDDGLVDGVPARTVNTIVAKNLTRTIGGKTYTNVIHTEVDFQYDYSGGYSTGFTYDFYLAKGIGVIESQFTILGSLYEEQFLIDDTIK
ncbi:MAG TPA: hypothetical protein VGN20_23875 [Mucilaginibacter sp.]|jgi:hypothetical protein